MRLKLLLLGILVICMWGTACSKREQTMETLGPRPKLDFSTPDRAVKSSWALETWRDTVSTSLERKMWFENMETMLSPYASSARDTVVANRRKEYEPTPAPKRVIESIAIETESRAVLIASEDLAPGLTVKYKYILTKEGKDWRIEDILSRCPYCDGTGRAKDSNPWIQGKTCTECGGVGWKSAIFSN
jgi:hypothetical protein